jgi:CheY-like chemotaxis protein
MQPAESPQERKTILLVEDNPADVLLIREALRENGVVYRDVLTKDGADAIRILEEMETSDRHPCPDVIILDLNIPKTHGLEVLRRVRGSEICGKTPVLVFSSSEAPSDRQGAIDLGADIYIRKPFDLAEFMSLGAQVKRLLDPSSVH